MVNRINLILRAKNITSKQFADEIGVQPSGMSHILSGRNNPSLDFVMKVVRRYPEIDINWLMFGKGEMYVPSYATPTPDPVPVVPTARQNIATGSAAAAKQELPLDLFSSVNDVAAEAQPVATENEAQRITYQQPIQTNVAEHPVNALPKATGRSVPSPVAVPQPTPEAEKSQNEENRKNENDSAVGGKDATLVKQKKIVKFVVLYDDYTFSEFYPER